MFLTGVVLFFVLCSLANEHPFLFSFFLHTYVFFWKFFFPPRHLNFRSLSCRSIFLFRRVPCGQAQGYNMLFIYEGFLLHFHFEQVILGGEGEGLCHAGESQDSGAESQTNLDSGVPKGLCVWMKERCWKRLLSLISAFIVIYWNAHISRERLNLFWLFFFLMMGKYTKNSPEHYRNPDEQKSLKIVGCVSTEVASKVLFEKMAFLLNPCGSGTMPCHLLDCPRSMFVNSHCLLH